MAEEGAEQPWLQVTDLTVTFFRPRKATVVDGLHFSMERGQSTALVGESGSGKSVSALALTRLLGKADHCRIEGSVRLGEDDLLAMPESALRSTRGQQVAYIFQEPAASLHPMIKIGPQVREVLKVRGHRGDLTKKALELLDRVHLKDPKRVIKAYPAELSGGMLQRVSIAMSLAGQPELLIADESTTALDATTQLHILELLRELQASEGMAMLFITHNFGILESIADHVVVMRAGKVVESGRTKTVLENPEHSYTKHLLDCVPRLGEPRERFPDPPRELV